MKKATLIAGGVLLAALFAASPAKAQWCYTMPPPAPDACGPGFYCQNYCGQWYGPNYNVYPPFAPFNGMVFAPPQGPAFPSHPFARSPRDFFMWEPKR
ncbi:MAG TPA: hypothetical protein VGX78_17285 [Pirellulales bacterium]|jgi:hypothetical protein|nr:hypothetical protein [Pirellulales bacterium]